MSTGPAIYKYMYKYKYCYLIIKYKFKYANLSSINSEFGNDY